MRIKLAAIVVSSLVILPGISANAANAPSNTNSPNGCQTQQQADTTLPGFPSIELTAEQKSQIRTIEDQIRSQILALLTPTQLGQLVKTLQKEGVRNEDVFASLSLTAEQRKKLGQIFQTSQKQILNTLTSSQLEQLRQEASPFTPITVEQMRRNVSPFGN